MNLGKKYSAAKLYSKIYNREMSKNQNQGNSRLAKLKKLILEVLKDQKELNRVLLNKNVGLLSPSLVQITDPRMISEERKIVEDIENKKMGAVTQQVCEFLIFWR